MCNSRPRDTLYTPCGHIVACNECVQKQDKPIMCNRCGIEVTEHTKVTFEYWLIILVNYEYCYRLRSVLCVRKC